MKTVILAGGLGTRISEETSHRPKPMIEIGADPILVHLMKVYASHGVDEFLIAGGYRNEVIKEYFANFELRHSDLLLDLRSGKRQMLRSTAPDWRVSVINTGLHTMTGGRIKQLQPLLGDQTFMVTYGDGLANVNVTELLAFHRSHDKLATITSVRPPARFGCLELDGAVVRSFLEKPQTESGWINGGFFVFEPGVFDYLGDDSTVLEREPLERLAGEGQLMAFQHHGFWQPMDTLREKQLLERLWSSGDAPWKVWCDAPSPEILPMRAPVPDPRSAAA